MAITRQRLERNFFRILNAVVEPLVRRGALSSRLAPGTLIVLETVGFKSGATRRTPLLSTRLGSYVFVSTARGDRSFWVRNLRKQPGASYYLGGRKMDATAFVLLPGEENPASESLPGIIRRISERLAPLTERGWAFAILKTETAA